MSKYCTVFSSNLFISLELILCSDVHGGTLLHRAAERSNLAVVDMLVNSLDRNVFTQLSSIRNKNGKRPIDLTDPEDMKLKIKSACVPVERFFKTDSNPTVLVFYMTIDREKAEVEKSTFCGLFEERGISPEVYKDPTEERTLTKVTEAAQRTDTSGLIVAVFGHGSKGRIQLKDKSMRIQTLLTQMTSSPAMLDKPKVKIISCINNSF